MKHIFIFFLLFITAPQAFSQCDIGAAFSNEQLNTIKQVKQLNTKDWLGRALSENNNEYEIDILYSPILKQYVVLLGEFHIKQRAAANLGKRLVDLFRFRQYELVPGRESVANGAELNEFLTVDSLVRSLTAFTSGRWQESTIFALMQKGLTFLPYQNNNVSHQNFFLQSPFFVQGYERNVVLENYQFISNNSPLEYDYVNLPLEIGAYLDPNDPDYILNLRNIRMTANMVFFMLNIIDKPTSIAVVGAAHNIGMIEILTNSYGFTHCPID